MPNRSWVILSVITSLAGATSARAQAAADSAAIYLKRGQLAIDSGATPERVAALPLILRAAALFRSKGDSLGEAEALASSYSAWTARSRYDSATAYLLRARDLYRAIGRKQDEADALERLYWNTMTGLSREAVRSYQREGLAIRRELKDKTGEVRALLGVARTFGAGVLPAAMESERDSALTYQRAAMTIARANHDTLGQLLALNGIGGSFLSLYLSGAHRERDRDSSAANFKAGIRLARIANNAREECADLGNLVTLYSGMFTERVADSAFAYAHASLDAARRLRGGPACSEISALHRIAQMQTQFGFADSARAYALEGLAIARRQGDSWESTLLALLARLDLQMGWSDSALMRYRESERSVRASGVSARLPAVWLDLANAHSQRGTADSALYYYRRVAFPATPDERGMTDLRPAALNALAEFFITRGRPDSAARCYQQLSELTRTTAPAYQPLLEIGLGRVAMATGALDSAMAHFQRATAYYARNSILPGEMASPLSWESVVDLNLGRIDTSLAKKRRALELFRRIDNRIGIANQLSGIGGLYANIGQPDSALFYYRASLAVNQQTHERGNIRSNYQSIASVYLNTDVQDSAMFYNRRALVISTEMDSPLSSASSLQSIGISFAALGQTDSARYYFQRALDLYRKYELSAASAATLANLAFERMRAAVADDSTFDLLRTALALRIQTQDMRGEGVTRQYLARAFLISGRSDSSLILAGARSSLPAPHATSHSRAERWLRSAARSHAPAPETRRLRIWPRRLPRCAAADFPAVFG